ncbi:LuxR C-terminal-related transcriptional regulator [Streptomyces sp. NPDC085524]|uniref:helix-turn-helix transcriptional regulator n=1 Tax=unclassified Streptomyces TaxID=2593676 RepID=UPI0035DD5523
MVDEATAQGDCITVGLVVARMSLRRRLTRLFTGRGWNAAEVEDIHDAPRCDVLVVDIDRLEEVRGSTPVAALTHGSDVRRLGAVRADVRAVLDLDDLDEAFLEAVEEVASGHGWISPTLVRPLLQGPGPNVPVPVHAAPHAPHAAHTSSRARRADPALTARESEVVSLVGQGMNNGEIAGALYIAESTVKFHMSNILQKTGFRDRSQLAARMPGQQPVGR